MATFPPILLTFPSNRPTPMSATFFPFLPPESTRQTNPHCFTHLRNQKARHFFSLIHWTKLPTLLALWRHQYLLICYSTMRKYSLDNHPQFLEEPSRSHPVLMTVAAGSWSPCPHLPPQSTVMKFAFFSHRYKRRPCHNFIP